MKIFRIDEYPPKNIPIDQSDLLVIQGPAWLCAIAFKWATHGWPVPAATAIQPDGESVATVVDCNYNGRHWAIGSTVTTK
jgi:hypothetical protein